MKVPCRVLRGSGGSSYFWDGVNPMTLLFGGIGAILVDNAGFDLPTVTLTTSNFDDLQDYLLGKKAAFDQLAACETCPLNKSERTFDQHVEAALLEAGVDTTVSG